MSDYSKVKVTDLQLAGPREPARYLHTLIQVGVRDVSDVVLSVIEHLAEKQNKQTNENKHNH